MYRDTLKVLIFCISFPHSLVVSCSLISHVTINITLHGTWVVMDGNVNRRPNAYFFFFNLQTEKQKGRPENSTAHEVWFLTIAWENTWWVGCLGRAWRKGALGKDGAGRVGGVQNLALEETGEVWTTVPTGSWLEGHGRHLQLDVHLGTGVWAPRKMSCLSWTTSASTDAEYHLVKGVPLWRMFLWRSHSSVSFHCWGWGPSFNRCLNIYSALPQEDAGLTSGFVKSI